MSESIATHVSDIMLRDLASLAEEVEATPDGLLWATVPGVTNPVGTLALHLCGNLRHFVGALLGGDGYVRDRAAEFARRDVSKEELLSEIRATREAVGRALASLPPGRMDEPMPDPPPRHAGRSVGYFLIQMSCHLSWHRGHLNYLRRILVEGGTANAGQR